MRAYVFLGFALLTGCTTVVSVNPLYRDTDRAIVFDPSLLGKWTGEDTTFTIVPEGKKAYRVVGFMAEKKELEDVTMHLVKVGRQMLLDVSLGRTGPELPCHVFLRVRIEPGTFYASLMSTQWLDERIKQDGKLKYEVKEGNTLLTCPSAELQKHLLPYARDKRAFDNEEGAFHRVK